MATDLQRIVNELAAFYDFAGRTVIDVGAGGGQLVEYARPAARVIAVDRDREALERLALRLAECGLAHKFTLLESDLFGVRPHGDVVLFEFCLHEIDEPERALLHARELAPDIVVIDHAPGSLWSWCAAEDEQVEAAWSAVERGGIRGQRSAEALQTFSDFPALEAKLAAQGPESLSRIRAYRGRRDITIPMPYRLALL